MRLAFHVDACVYVLPRFLPIVSPVDALFLVRVRVFSTFSLLALSGG